MDACCRDDDRCVQRKNKLKSVVEAHPELIERSIQQGDVFAVACGEKEPRGCVCALGLGPTSQDIGTPGLKCYKPTRLQMEVLARKKVESDKASLERRIQELEEKLDEARIVQQRRNMEIASHNGSNSRTHVSPTSEEHVDEAHDAQPFEDAIFEDINENSNHYDEDYYALVPSPQAAPSEHDANFLSVVGKEVTLYALLRPEVVAKATVISTNPRNLLGGQPLGKHFCEVVVKVVIKRNTVLPRPYGDIETLADALSMPIQWPYNRLSVTKASHSSKSTTAREERRGHKTD